MDRSHRHDPQLRHAPLPPLGGSLAARSPAPARTLMRVASGVRGMLCAAAAARNATLRVALGLALLAPTWSSAWAQDIGRTPQAPGHLIAQAPALQIDELAKGLSHPWALAFLPGPDVDLLLTERDGALRRWRPAQGLSQPLQGVPDVYAKGQGGLLDVAVSPNFAHDRLVYLSFAQAADDGKAATAVGQGRLSDDGTRLEGFTVLFQQRPALSSGQHFGSRLVFDRNGQLYVALGEHNQRATSQDLDKLQGKVVRLNADGTVPNDNPFVGQQGALPEIWSYGHRNQQGAALNPRTGRLWTHEHGPRGGDEINIPQAGGNYGWPLATYGRNYTGFAIPEAKGTQVEGTLPPFYYWEKSPAISGMAFYDAPRFPAWQSSLFIGALAGKALIRLQLDAEQRIVGEQWLLRDLGERIRDVRSGPDGYLYLLTDSNNGRLLRVGLSE